MPAEYRCLPDRCHIHERRSWSGEFRPDITARDCPLSHRFRARFFANPETEKRDYAELYAAFESLENLKTRVTDSAANLELALQFLKIDLNDPKLIAYAMTVIEAKVKLIEAIYNEPGYSK